MLLCTWANTHCYFSLVHQLGWLGSGWQPNSKTGEAGNYSARRRLNPMACRWPGGQGGVQEHEEAVGDWFEAETKPTRPHRALSTAVKLSGREPASVGRRGGRGAHRLGQRGSRGCPGAHGGRDGAGLSQRLTAGGSALWCLLTRQLEDGARSKEVKLGTRWQLRRRLAWWLVNGIAWRGAVRCLDEQGRAGEVDGEKQRGGASELGFDAIAHARWG
jgi:hypothetical protein